MDMADEHDRSREGRSERVGAQGLGKGWGVCVWGGGGGGGGRIPNRQCQASLAARQLIRGSIAESQGKSAR